MFWIDWIALALTPIAIVLGVLPILLAIRFRRYVTRELARPLTGYTPKVSIILPCKGLDPGFEENIQAVFNQDYPDFEIIFATATDDDDACEPLQRMIAAHPQVEAKLVHAGLPTTCSQQNNNQLKGVESTRQDTEILVIMDSDIRPHSQYLSHLVDPLNNPKVGATTGYRWYMPVTGGLGSWLRSTWNMGALPILVDPKRNFTWGGSMAFRAQQFSHKRLVELWGNALSDDHTLTTALRQLGLEIRYVPQCLAVSNEDSTMSETLEWTTRQTIVTRVYDKPFWWTVLGIHTTSVIFTLLAFIGCGTVFIPHFYSSVIMWLFPVFILPVLGQIAALSIIWPSVMELLPDDVSEKLSTKRRLYLTLAQPASLLALWNTSASLLTNRVCWRGTIYEMRSPTKMVVINPTKT